MVGGREAEQPIEQEGHALFSRQAEWTRSLRAYLFERVGIERTWRVLEVGCGTGAVLTDFLARVVTHGLDIRLDYLFQARRHAPAARLTCGDALTLPYACGVFDVVFCHYLLLWVAEPLAALLEMRRVTRPGGYILALAEPDYAHRVDRPCYLVPLGRWQRRALQRRGADTDLGARLESLFAQAGLQIMEAGILRPPETGLATEDDEEWTVLEGDLTGYLPAWFLQGMKLLHERARQRGKRVLFVPTHFALGRLP